MNYNTIKTAKLREVAEKKEIEGYEEMTRKELIKSLKSKNQKDKPTQIEGEVNRAIEDEESVEKKEEPEKEEEPEAVKDKEPEEEKVVGIREAHVPVGSKAEVMKAKLAKQPRVKILIPLEGKEKMGSTESVILNGYRLNILKGVYVDVPEQVAGIIMESQKQTRIAAQEFKRMESRAPMKIEGAAPSELNK